MDLDFKSSPFIIYNKIKYCQKTFYNVKPNLVSQFIEEMCNKSVIGLVHSGNEDEIGYIILPHTNENKSNIINIKHDGVTITLSHYIESLH